MSQNTQCPNCEKGDLIKSIQAYKTTMVDGQVIEVPEVEIEQCNTCGFTLLPLSGAEKVSLAIAEESERLSLQELRKIRENFGVDQGQMSDILGLGSKTYHRWENGVQFPSRSMGFYIRVLSAFPQAFEWLRKRKWRTVTHGVDEHVFTLEITKMFPNLSEERFRNTEHQKVCVPPRALLQARR